MAAPLRLSTSASFGRRRYADEDGAPATGVERVVHDEPGTTSAFAERLVRGRFVEMAPDRAAARCGLSVQDVQEVVALALGGETVTTTVAGREGYGRLRRIAVMQRA